MVQVSAGWGEGRRSLTKGGKRRGLRKLFGGGVPSFGLPATWKIAKRILRMPCGGGGVRRDAVEASG